MVTAKCPSCGDVMHQHRLPDDFKRAGTESDQPPKSDSPTSCAYRCGECGRLYRLPVDKE